MFKLYADTALVKSAHWSEENNVLRLYSGVPLLKMNGIIFGSYDQMDLPMLIQKEVNFFKHKPIPGFIWYVEESEKEFQDALMKQDFGMLGRMYVAIKPTDSVKHKKLPKNMYIQHVEDEESLDVWLNLVSDIFEYSPEAKRACRKINMCFGFGDMSPIRRYILYVDGKPAVVLSFIMGNDVAFLSNVGTLKEFRRMGLGEILIVYALSEAEKIGCPYVASQIMDGGMALGICQRLGFQPIWSFYAYIWTK